ncbi:hypothetical protein [Pararhizobium sp.]|uniref:hypothetical protein n=1 Tax=Pararhizobium sp. TaxID=1977563 RepID=UPI003D0A0A57
MQKIVIGLSAVVLLGAAAGTYVFLDREQATVSVDQGYGPSPVLPKPNATILPTVNIAEAASWPEGKTPTAAEGLKVNALRKTSIIRDGSTCFPTGTS